MFKQLAITGLLVLATAGVASAQSNQSTTTQTIDQSGAAVNGSSVVNQASQNSTTVNSNYNGRFRRNRGNNDSVTDQFIIQTGVGTDGSAVVNQAEQNSRTINRNRRR